MRASLAIIAALAVTATARAGTIESIVASNPQLSTLASLLSASGLSGTLGGAGPYTLFAPTDDAFASLESYRVAFMKANAMELTAVLKYHVAPKSVDRSSLTVNEKIHTIEGSNIFVEYVTNSTMLGLDSATCEKDVQFVGSQISASNGMIQIIDQVLMPPGVFCPDSLFFVEQRGESRVGYVGYDCRAKGTTVLSNNEEKPVGLAVDSNTKQVFWSNDQNAKPFDSWLTESNFDGSSKKVFLNDLFDPQGMDTDENAKKLYFTEHQGFKVHRSNYDGSDIETIKTLNSANEFPADVVVDPEEQLVFFTIQSQPQVLEGKLAVMAYNGSNYRVLKKGLIQNYGLCIDTRAKHVYYIQGGHGGSISCYPYGGVPCGGDKGVLVSGLEYPYMCAVDNLWAPYGGPTTIIFSEANVPGSVYAMDTTGENLRVINTDLNAPMGVKLGCVRYDA